MTPRVSVLTVARNRREYFDELCAGVRSQTDVDYEWVVVDNASDDGVRDRWRQLAAEDRRVRLILSDRNLGVRDGLRLALPECRAEFLAMLDNDDVYLRGRLSKPLPWLEGGAEHLVAYSDCEIIDGQSRPLPSWFIARDAVALRSLAEFDMPAIHCSATYRTDWLKSVAPSLEFSDRKSVV